VISQIEDNKNVVIRFNKEVIEQGNLISFKELMDDEFVNRTAAPSTSAGPDGMLNTFNNILRPAFPDLKVEILDQICEGDKVSTRKRIHGTHKGEIMGIKPTNKSISIDVIDIVRIRNGKYIEHWGINNMAMVISQLKGN
jgi:predicted ester cyclase